MYAGYNDTVPYAQLTVVEQGRLVRQFLQDEQDASENVDVGELPEETTQRLGDWVDAMAWIESDEEKLSRPEQGLLWIHRAQGGEAE